VIKYVHTPRLLRPRCLSQFSLEGVTPTIKPLP
jgi:hypothetical protein